MRTFYLFWLLVSNPGLFAVKGAAGAIFRILAWPPSRARFDAIVSGKY